MGVEYKGKKYKETSKTAPETHAYNDLFHSTTQQTAKTDPQEAGSNM